LPILEIIPDWLLIIISALLVLRLFSYVRRTVFGVPCTTEKFPKNTQTPGKGRREPAVSHNKFERGKTPNKEVVEADGFLSDANNLNDKNVVGEEVRRPSVENIPPKKLEDRIRKKLGVDKVINDVAGSLENSRSGLTEEYFLERQAQINVLDSLKRFQRFLTGLENHSDQQVDKR